MSDKHPTYREVMAREDVYDPFDEPIFLEKYPERCYLCENYQVEGEVGLVITVDNDPGDPEVGPQPDIIQVWICDGCKHDYKERI